MFIPRFHVRGSRMLLESQVGLNFLCNHSGKLRTKKPSLKDVRCNGDATQLHQIE